FKFNLVANHASLAGHTFEHELHYARIHNILLSVDAIQAHPLLDWDTDEFPTDLHATVIAMYENLQHVGLGRGALNFYAKVRREAVVPEDLFHAHIAGMDSFAVGLKVAQRLIDDKVLENIVDDPYKSYKEGIGLDIVEGNTDLRKLEEHALGL